MNNIKNKELLLPYIDIITALTENGGNSIYIDGELEEQIDAYDSEILEKNNFDISKTLKTLGEEIVVEYIITDEMLKNYALHYIEDELYRSYDNQETYLEISDRRVLNEINAENLIGEIYYQEAYNELRSFENYIANKYNAHIEILNLGRSGRHICIPLTYINIIMYKTIESEYRKIEENFIEYINDFFYT